MEKTIKARVQHKHDVEANWLKATNFIPLASEIIVYEPDENYDYPRIKIGDGKTNINTLPFVTKDYAKISDIPTKPEDIGALPDSTVIPTVPTKISAFENDKGYLTQHQSLDAYAKTADLGALATKDSLTASDVGALPDTTEIPSKLSDLSEDTTHRLVTDTEKSTWNAKSNFSGSYDDLTNKPTIPSIAGLASTTYVDNAVKNKVDKDGNKVLSTNDYTTAEKNKLANIAAGAEVNVNADWNATSGDAQILNKPTLGSMAAKSSVAKSDLASGVQTSLGKADSALQPGDISDWAKASTKPSYTKSEVGLGNVDNTSDANKPVSTAQASAIAEAKKAGTNAQSNLTTHMNNKANPHGVTKAQVGLGNVDNVKQYSADNPPPYPVTSVNGKTGEVNIDTIITMTQEEYNNLSKTDLAEKYAQGVRIIAILDANGEVITYNNLVPTSIDTDGSVYNGTGYKEGVRLSSSGDISSSGQADSVTTGFMPFTSLGVVRIKGARWMDTSDGRHWYINFYDSSKKFIYGQTAQQALGGGTSAFAKLSVVYNEATGVTTLDPSNMDTTTIIGSAWNTGVYFRMNLIGNGANLIITVNEEI